ncbi:MAG: hypothetical protein DRH08_03365 [Deltaproteobacteria bacterium]|nr:MAG: hypothetical protein DRH08_03365 [Deltaproteobacteria bacterium]
MSTRKLTIRLPEEEIDFAKQYASSHGLTMTQLIDRYLKQLRRRSEGELNQNIIRFSGIIPENNGTRDDYFTAMEEKHK